MKDDIDKVILGFLLFLSVIALALILERFVFFARVRLDKYEDKRILEIELHKRLTLLATIGTNAPYVGLLGTIFGIMVTFIDIGNSANIDTKVIMVGLSLALKATAAGIIVALPCIVSYNLLLRRAEVILKLFDVHRDNLKNKSIEQMQEMGEKRYDIG